MTGWKLENISRQAREAAKAAARKEKMTLGEWLSRLILKAAESQKKGPKAASKADPD